MNARDKGGSLCCSILNLHRCSRITNCLAGTSHFFIRMNALQENTIPMGPSLGETNSLRMKRPSKRWSMSSCSFMYTIKALEGSSAFFHPFLHYKVKRCKFNSNSNLKGWIKVHNFHSLRRFGQCQDYAPAQARRKGGAIYVWHTLPPAISREDHSSYCSGRHSPAPEPRRRWEKFLKIERKTVKTLALAAECWNSLGCWAWVSTDNNQLLVQLM